jgi:O-acetylhomoserine/O-acetylserine sulfhydrylase-like pyridoxal-dependent enzyme
MNSPDDLCIDTRVIHLAEGQAPDARPLTTPIYETTTFLFESAEEVRGYNEGRSQRFLYSRYENPTIVSVERKIAALEGAEAALVFSSGMAAVATTLMGLLGEGDELLCSAAVYGGTLHLIEEVLGRFGVPARFVSLDELRDPAASFSSRSRLLWF